MINDKLKVRGSVTLRLIREDGTVVTHEENIVTTVGLGMLTSRFIEASTAVLSHLALGTSVTTAAREQTTLGSEVERNALASITRLTTTNLNDTIQYTCTFGPSEATGAITEAGIFNAAFSGDMSNRVVFPVINKGASDTLALDWRIIFS